MKLQYNVKSFLYSFFHHLRKKTTIFYNFNKNFWMNWETQQEFKKLQKLQEFKKLQKLRKFKKLQELQKFLWITDLCLQGLYSTGIMFQLDA